MNPLAKIAVPVAGLAAAVVGQKLIAGVWSAVFGEDAPTDKAAKASRKETSQRRKAAKKEGLSKSEVQQISDPIEDQPIWKALLWLALSTVALQGLRLAARRGTAEGVEKLTNRRPRSNRG